MKNKTCGECKYFVGNGEDCIYYCNIESTDAPCECFKKPTNGDRIRQMSDEELVGFVDCSACIYAGHDCANQDCTEGKLAWLKQEAKDE
jgi:hypothetical protein